MQDKAERFGASVQQVGYFGRLAMHAVHDCSFPKTLEEAILASPITGIPEYQFIH
jgi:hypothetical protein